MINKHLLIKQKGSKKRKCSTYLIESHNIISQIYTNKSIESNHEMDDKFERLEIGIDQSNEQLLEGGSSNNLNQRENQNN